MDIVPDRPDDAGGATRGRDFVITRGSTETDLKPVWKKAKRVPSS
jgi:hypothetical protein